VCAPAWSDCAARAVLHGLQAGAAAAGKTLLDYSSEVLRTGGATEAFLARQKHAMDVDERTLAASIMQVHRERLLPSAEEDERKAAAKRFLKPLRDRKASRGEVGALRVEPVPEGRGPTTFHAWLSADYKKDRHRDISKSRRITTGLAKWPLSWLTTPGVVCYERAAGRARSEKGGDVPEKLARSLVHTKTLPTIVASASDHCVLVTKDAPPRFLTVQEVSRAFGVPEGGPLDAMLRSDALTPTQALTCLGGGIHVGVATQLVKHLRKRGLLSAGLTYGSAYSGIDMFAAAVEAEFGANWTYEFASEANATVRAGLISAWEPRGLSMAKCYTDSEGLWARLSAPTVDLFVTTPKCNLHSRRNHHVERADVCASLMDVWRSLEYVRTARPKVVVVENVNEPSAIGGIGGLLARLAGYEAEGGTLEPQEVAGAPVARDRHYWVLVRTGGETCAAGASAGPGAAAAPTMGEAGETRIAASASELDADPPLEWGGVAGDGRHDEAFGGGPAHGEAGELDAEGRPLLS
jgi:hypothetical protein